MHVTLRCSLSFLLLILCLSPALPKATFDRNDEASSSLRQNNFFEWLASILRPRTTTTTTTPSTPQRECPTCSCGRINTIRRIVGGHETVVRAYPWMTLLLSNGNFFCGGSLINDLYVATAAHCLTEVQQGALTMRFLVHDRRNSSMYEINRRAALIVIHENYNRRTADNDIGLIRLSSPVEFDDQLRPVCMPTENRDFAGDQAIVTGWGRLSEGGQLSNTLQEVEVPVLSQEECRNSNYGASRITDNMLCAGVEEGGKDSCQGDSGGPLHTRVNNSSTEYQLAGIVSWGEGCAEPRLPGVYARVTRYTDWYAERTRDGCKCPPPSDDGEQEEEGEEAVEASAPLNSF